LVRGSYQTSFRGDGFHLLPRRRFVAVGVVVDGDFFRSEPDAAREGIIKVVVKVPADRAEFPLKKQRQPYGKIPRAMAIGNLDNPVGTRYVVDDPNRKRTRRNAKMVL
jgi:hypothetical protein